MKSSRFVDAGSYTRRRLGGRQPLCGTGVTSRMAEISRPAFCRARIAESRPTPGPLTQTSTRRNPMLTASCAARSAASCPAKGVDFRLPPIPTLPGVAQEITLPSTSVRVMIVLLKVERMCATPKASTFFAFLRRRRPLSGGNSSNVPLKSLMDAHRRMRHTC